jgi:arsenite/tail-anchored protein-transporting ATPase
LLAWCILGFKFVLAALIWKAECGVKVPIVTVCLISPVFLVSKKTDIFFNVFCSVCSLLRIIIYTGKGGTGKTVLSCSTAVNLADNNHKTLILSSDPAHTLSDAFMMDYIGNEPSKVIDNLYALQVDPVIEINKHFNSILSYLASTFFSKGVDETLSYELAMLPGMTQLFSLLKIEEVMHDGDYEAIVLDMPASGEALRYLYFPKLAGSIGRKLTGFTGVFSGFAKMFQAFSGFPSSSSSRLPPSNVLQKELDLMGRLDSLSKLITDSDATSLRLVANPDTFSIENAKRALMSANLYGINVDLVIINKIMPKGSPDKYFANWAEFQNRKVEEAISNFYPLPVKEARLYEKELRGIEMLGENAKSLFGKDDPSRIFYSGKVFEFLKEGDSSLRIKMKVPFTEKADFDISRYGEQLAIKVKGPTGYITNVVPLPVATIGMNLSRAKLDKDDLNLFFEKRP